MPPPGSSERGRCEDRILEYNNIIRMINKPRRFASFNGKFAARYLIEILALLDIFQIVAIITVQLRYFSFISKRLRYVLRERRTPVPPTLSAVTPERLRPPRMLAWERDISLVRRKLSWLTVNSRLYPIATRTLAPEGARFISTRPISKKYDRLIRCPN